VKRVTDYGYKVYFRADRFHRSGGCWYFLTREGNDIGPFKSKALAEAELAKYLGIETTPPANS
jgi:Domain of unknown function (DUF6316)